MPTGEQPAVTISDKTSFAWPILIALIAVAAWASVGYSRAQDAGIAVKEHTADIQTLKVDSAENKSDHKAIKELLERMDRKMDRLEAKLDAKK